MNKARAMLLASGHITLESKRVESETIALLEYEWIVEMEVKIRRLSAHERSLRNYAGQHCHRTFNYQRRSFV